MFMFEHDILHMQELKVSEINLIINLNASSSGCMDFFYSCAWISYYAQYYDHISTSVPDRSIPIAYLLKKWHTTYSWTRLLFKSDWQEKPQGCPLKLVIILFIKQVLKWIGLFIVMQIYSALGNLFFNLVYCL